MKNECYLWINYSWWRKMYVWEGGKKRETYTKGIVSPIRRRSLF